LSSKIRKTFDGRFPHWGGGHPLPTSYPLGALGASILVPTALVLQSLTEIAATDTDRQTTATTTLMMLLIIKITINKIQVNKSSR